MTHVITSIFQGLFIAIFNKKLLSISDYFKHRPTVYPSQKKFFSKIVNDINVKKVKKFKRSNVSHLKV